MNSLYLLLKKNVIPEDVKIEIEPGKNPIYYIFPPMFALTKNGGIKTYDIEVRQINDKKYEIIRIHASKMGGRSITDVSTIEKGVNVGKKNETTVGEQAIFEARSLVSKLQDQGYKTYEHLGIDPLLRNISEEEIKKALGGTHNTDAAGQIKPMLAGKDITKAIYPLDQQPKLNGHRCLAIRDEKTVTLLSRKGKPVYNEFIRDELMVLMKPGEVFDGELYCHTMSLQEIASAVRTEGDHPDKGRVQFVVFDLPGDGLWVHRASMMYKIQSVRNIPDFIPKGPFRVAFLQHAEVSSDRDMRKHHAAYVKEGFEGSILRNRAGKYEYGYRSQNLIKVKEFWDDEFKIVGVEEASGRDAGTAVFVFSMMEGGTFKARPEGTLEQRKKYWIDRKKMIGQIWTVRYAELSADGVPQHPVAVAKRTDL